MYKKIMLILIATFFSAYCLCSAEQMVKLEKFELQNGLRVIMSENHSSPIVGYAVYYNVGSRNEIKGRTGFAHLFEHLMFQGSENIPRNMHHMWIGRAGGNDNGSTNQDRTNYFATVPSNQLELVLWEEADRMKALSITKENFENQRATVKEEKRQSHDNQPYSEAEDKFYEMVFESFSYQHSVIGSMDDLNAAELKDVKEFFDTYYAPNNAVLTIVGDINLAETKKLVEKYFGSIPPRVPPPQVILNEPERTQEKKLSLIDKYANLPVLLTGYQIPRRLHPDTYALRLLADILFEGDSSRFYQKLVKEKEMALSVEGDADIMRGAGVFNFMIMIKPDKNLTDVLNVALDEIEKVKKTAVNPEELHKVKNKLKTRTLGYLEKNLGRAMFLSEYELYDGDANLINTELDKYMAVTDQDIIKVAKKYFTRHNRNVITVYPASYKLPDESFRKTVPFNEKPLAYKFPASKEKATANGMLIQAFEDHSIPKMNLQFVMKGGAYYEPKDKTGISSLLAAMLKTGTKNYPGSTLSEKIDSLGASVDITAGPDTITITASMLKEYSKEVIGIISDIILNPAFNDDDFGKEVRKFQAKLIQQRSSPLFLASEMLYKKVFGEHPYAHISTPAGAPYVNMVQILPSDNFLKTVKKQDIIDYYKKFFIPNNALIIAVGDVNQEDFFNEIETKLAGWNKGSVIEEIKIPEPAKPAKNILYLVDRPDSVQSYILLGNLLFARDNKDYIPLLVANKILGGGRHIGGGGTGRLFMNLREEKGWTYGCYSWLMPYMHSGIFAINAEVRTEVTAPALKEILKEVERIRKGDATDQDAKYAKSFLGGVLPLVNEGSSGLANAAVILRLNNLPADYWDSYSQQIDKVSFDQMKKAASDYMSLSNFSLVVVGDSSKIEKDLKPLCDEIIKFDAKGNMIK